MRFKKLFSLIIDNFNYQIQISLVAFCAVEGNERSMGEENRLEKVENKSMRVSYLFPFIKYASFLFIFSEFPVLGSSMGVTVKVVIPAEEHSDRLFLLLQLVSYLLIHIINTIPTSSLKKTRLFRLRSRVVNESILGLVDYRIIFRTIFFTWLPECIKKIAYLLCGSVLL